MPYELAIFDFDGTICATDEAIRDALRHTCLAFNETLPDHVLLNETISQGITIKDTFLKLAPEYFVQNHNAIDDWVSHYRSFYQRISQSRTRLFDGIPRLFKQLNDHHLPIIVLSNKKKAAVDVMLHRFNLKPYIRAVVGESHKHPPKPDPALYELEIKPSFKHIKQNQILIIGDTVADIQLAHNIGVHSCWAAYGYGVKPDCLAALPTFTITHPDALVQILLEPSHP